MGTVAQVPRRFGQMSPAGSGPKGAAEERTDRGPLAEQATARPARAEPSGGPRLAANGAKAGDPVLALLGHRSLSTLLMVLASITENDELVAAVAGPGSVSRT